MLPEGEGLLDRWIIFLLSSSIDLDPQCRISNQDLIRVFIF